ncbi:MAG: hypothetical protein NTV08_11615 [Verrucomicrobia bacterium]|nr:hypothetical protein [Verrucomicrobiota bacterium]
MFRRFIKKIFIPPMVVLAALFMFVEEWLWDHLTTFMAWVARAPVFRWLEKKLAALPPYGAMAVFLVPGALLLPVKIAALYFMTHGHPGGGLSIIIAAKIIGTAIVARIFTVCRPSLLTVRWFRRLYEWIVRVKTRLYTAIKSMPAWATAVRWKNAIKAMLPKKGFLTRQWKAITQVVRRKFSRKT